MILRRIPFVAQKELPLTYKGEALHQIYKPDLICFGKIIVELKAVKEMAPEHKAQVINYLKATGFKLGLLVNVASYPKATITRLALSLINLFRAFRAFRGYTFPFS